MHRAIATLTILLACLPLAPRAEAGGTACGQAGALCPDLKMVVPRHLNVQNEQQREMLRWSQGLANDGPGPFWVQPKETVGATTTTVGVQVIFDCTDPVAQQEFCGCSPDCIYPQASLPACPGVSCSEVSEFVFHETHNHWHLAEIAQYEVRLARDDGTGGAFGKVFVNDAGPQEAKVGFCMFDDYKLDGSNGPTSERNMWSCEVGAQGVTGRNDPAVPGTDHSGWADQYHHSLEGQEIDVTGAPVGVYYLVATINPAGRYLELDSRNNTAWTSFVLTRDSMGNPKVEVITTSPCSSIGLCGGVTKNG